MGARKPAGLRIVTVALGVAALAACATPPPAPPPPPPPPPPPKVVVIPPRPTPPPGAVERMAIPAVGLDGVRQTVNSNISPTQELWNLRSALNVAALNCQRPQHAMLIENYKILLKRHARELARANSDLATEYRKQHGSNYRKVQDSYMTRVYNYFALPPTLPEFCDTALQVSQEVAQVAPNGLKEFSATGLPRVEAVFENFYRNYEQYRVDLAAWDSRYGSASLPSYGPQASTYNLNAQYRPSTGSTAIEETDLPASTANDSASGITDGGRSN